MNLRVFYGGKFHIGLFKAFGVALHLYSYYFVRSVNVRDIRLMIYMQL